MASVTKKKANKRARVGKRRPPRTRVGQEIVQAILNAAAQILSVNGYASMTTNHLAERAGVSIGSLYHYFPNKESVIQGLAERLERRAIDVLEHRSRTVPSTSSDRDLARELGTSLFAQELGGRETRRSLLLEVPRRWIQAASEARDAAVRARLEMVLREHTSVTDDDVNLRAFVLKHAVQGVVEGTLVHRPELVGSDDLTEEITRLIVRYTRD